jgi:hypothetical protein
MIDTPKETIMGVGSIVGGAVRGGVDYISYPISMGVEAITGKSIGDYISGNQRPPSQNGFMGGAMSFATNVLVPAALPLIPVVGIPLALAYPVANVASKAITGNSFGDYVTGNTDAARREADNKRIDSEYAQVQQRTMARQHGMGHAQEQVVAPSVGMQQQHGHMHSR